jgi:hypothetical protein
LTLREIGKRAEAQALLQQSYDTLASYLAPGHPYLATAKARLEGATQ